MWKILKKRDYQLLQNELAFQKEQCHSLVKQIKDNQKDFDTQKAQYDDTNNQLRSICDALNNQVCLIRDQNAQIKRDNRFLLDLLTDQNLTAYDLDLKIHRMNFILCLQKIVLQKQQSKIDDRNKTIEHVKKELVTLEDEMLYQSFGLYTPLYDACSSDTYKTMINDCRNEQKTMIRNGNAAVCPFGWLVNNSIVLGRHFVKQSIKHIIRSFNNECEYLISKVKYNNIENIQKRIEKSFNDLNKLNSSHNLYLTDEYLALKIKELRLCYEYQQKKQDEKEQARILREERREQAKLAEEIKEQRKKIEKEQTHYNNYLSQLQFQISHAHDQIQIHELQIKINDTKSTLANLNKSLADIDYREANERAGYVYIISNIGAFGDNVYKIGMTRRLNPQDRIDELSDASVPFKFDVHAMIFSDNAPALESALHKAFDDRRVNLMSNRKEFFRVSLDEIKDVVHKNYDKSVDFVNIPSAQQYRESMQLRKQIEDKHKSD